MYRIILFLSLLILSQPSFALGKLGHQLVCQLAFDHLSTAKQQRVNTLLANLPNKDRTLINHYLYQAPNTNITFAKSCIWPDAIKKDPSFDKFKPWHYLNVSRKQAHIKQTSCKTACITQGIKFHQKALKTEVNPWKKVQALMFLGHWLGDIHQPLHISFADDLGGNKVKINSPDKKCTNLHWLWDTCLLSREHLSTTQWLKKLNAQWQKSPISTWQNSPVWQWADESFQLARQQKLGYCRQIKGECVVNKNSSQLYSDKYLTYFSPILQTRVVQAAARLSKLLEQSI